jgi:cell division ATPase FtsA
MPQKQSALLGSNQSIDYVADLAQPRGQGIRRGIAVQNVRQAAQQVSQQVAAAGLGGDIQLDRTAVAIVEIYDQSEHVEIDRTEVQIENIAVAVAARRGLAIPRNLPLWSATA